ncbi:exonuclease V, alpha chain [Candidatus Blochmanniella floridana]|uniref:RecBCD enzyme subunit RecD n=1 Tax=Blochmanniella floridana TaxID=203907 RepID=Q7VRF0_BLOFL|nr:exonuclease V, alpha chain [Candidatus Blochmannia floridanus]
MQHLLKKIISLKLHNELDIQFSKMLITESFPCDNTNNYYHNIKKIVLMLASIYVSTYVRSGHTCLPIYLLSSGKLFQNYHPDLIHEIIQKTKKLSTNDWQDILLSSSAVGDGSSITPLVLNNRRLYLHYIWEHECTVAKFFVHHSNDDSYLDQTKITIILNKLFLKTSKEINWHKIATALSMIHSRILISGEAGTGKTSTIAQIITALLLYNNKLRIKMVTPTGKSATVLTHACHKIFNDLNQLHMSNVHTSDLKATTIHNFLGLKLYNKYKYQYQYYSNYLNTNIDCLIIDEASMISLSLLSQLIMHLSNNTKVILIGDHHQLHPIESGSVFQDICQFSNFGYSIQQQEKLKKLTNHTLSMNNSSYTQNNYCNTIADKICIFKKNYRFHKNSGIIHLAKSVKIGDYNQTLFILHSKQYTDLSYNHLQKKKDYINLIIHCAKKYSNYLKIIQNNKVSIKHALKIFEYYRILCALRHGPFGVTQLNHYIEQVLNDQSLITLNHSGNYIGRPIIILQNEPSLELYNGEIGLLLLNSQNYLSAYFLSSLHEIKTIPINQLPSYETCFAMTIHKAQGSEFQHISIIFPYHHTPILTRELLYTAITRARQHLDLYATDNVLIHTINLMNHRYSGLFDQIKKYSYM